MKQNLIYNDKLFIWQTVGVAFTSIFGTLLHFLYEWTGNAVWSALISGVNESTWEHLKLFFLPTFIFAIIQSYFFLQRKDFWFIKLKGICLGLVLIPIIFYTYNGVIGKSPDWFNISIFYVATIIAYFYEYKQLSLKQNYGVASLSIIPFLVLCLFALAFIIFTFFPLSLAIFKSPI